MFYKKTISGEGVEGRLELDALERNSLPDRRYWLKSYVWSCQSHINVVYWLTVLNTNVIHNCRDTLSEPRILIYATFQETIWPSSRCRPWDLTRRDNMRTKASKVLPSFPSLILGQDKDCKKQRKQPIHCMNYEIIQMYVYEAEIVWRGGGEELGQTKEFQAEPQDLCILKFLSVVQVLVSYLYSRVQTKTFKIFHQRSSKS